MHAVAHQHLAQKAAGVRPFGPMRRWIDHSDVHRICRFQEGQRHAGGRHRFGALVPGDDDALWHHMLTQPLFGQHQNWGLAFEHGRFNHRFAFRALALAIRSGQHHQIGKARTLGNKVIHRTELRHRRLNRRPQSRRALEKFGLHRRLGLARLGLGPVQRDLHHDGPRSDVGIAHLRAIHPQHQNIKMCVQRLGQSCRGTHGERSISGPGQNRENRLIGHRKPSFGRNRLW